MPNEFFEAKSKASIVAGVASCVPVSFLVGSLLRSGGSAFGLDFDDSVFGFFWSSSVVLGPSRPLVRGVKISCERQG